MKIKRLLAILLTMCMIGGLLPSAFAEESESGLTLVYDFRATAIEGYTGTNTIRDNVINNWTLDRTKSTGYWKYESQTGVPYIGFQFNGLCLYTNNAEQPPNDSAMVFTIEIPSSATYSASVSDHKVYAKGYLHSVVIHRLNIVSYNLGENVGRNEENGYSRHEAIEGHKRKAGVSHLAVLHKDNEG